MDPELGAAVRKAAKRAGASVSAWLGEAAADRLRNQLLGQALDAWEASEGAFSESELSDAATALRVGVRRRRRKKP